MSQCDATFDIYFLPYNRLAIFNFNQARARKQSGFSCSYARVGAND